MNLRQPSVRWALWVFAAALLLKAAMPWLASASAQAQGKTLVEVCTVYGVALQPLNGDGHQPASDHAPDHASDHCALTALTALASAEVPALAVLRATQAGAAAPDRRPSRASDACASWVARLQHGPPARA